MKNQTKPIDKSEQISRNFLNISRYTLFDNISEMISEWWSCSQKDIPTFLKDEELSDIINEKEFIDILLGKYYFSSTFLSLIKEKLPYNVSLEKLRKLNNNASSIRLGKILFKENQKLTFALLKKIYNAKKERNTIKSAKYRKTHEAEEKERRRKYRETHREQIRELKRKYRETHKEQIKAYKQSHRTIINAQQRRKYHEDIEKSREQKHIYAEKHRETIRQRQNQYRQEHRDEINARFRKNMENEEYHQKVRKRQNLYYQRNATKIQERRKLARLENLEHAKELERQYGKTYREKHREQIKAKIHENYQKNLSKNRARNAKNSKKYRDKKRFRTQTAQIIMPLLSAIIAAKTQKE